MIARQWRFHWAILTVIVLLGAAGTTALCSSSDSGDTVAVSILETKPPKPFIISVGFQFLQDPLRSNLYRNPPDRSKSGISAGVTGEIPVSPDFYLGVTFDYLSKSDRDTKLLFGLEVTGSVHLLETLSLQFGLGYAHSNQHAMRIPVRLVLHRHSEVGFALEFTYWDPSAYQMRNFSTLRTGVVF